jgi:hypothetical protein
VQLIEELFSQDIFTSYWFAGCGGERFSLDIQDHKAVLFDDIGQILQRLDTLCRPALSSANSATHDATNSSLVAVHYIALSNNSQTQACSGGFDNGC